MVRGEGVRTTLLMVATAPLARPPKGAPRAMAARPEALLMAPLAMVALQALQAPLVLLAMAVAMRVTEGGRGAGMAMARRGAGTPTPRSLAPPVPRTLQATLEGGRTLPYPRAPALRRPVCMG